jgi:hypothetical protein
MRKLININRCTRCHSKKDLYVNSKYKTKQGVERIAYMCRKCNTERIKKYMKNAKNRDIVYKSVYASIKRHKNKQNARAKLGYHIRKGNIIKPKICSICEKAKKIEGHHTDYSKPLLVTWTCRQCHADLHKREDKL